MAVVRRAAVGASGSARAASSGAAGGAGGAAVRAGGARRRGRRGGAAAPVAARGGSGGGRRGHLRSAGDHAHRHGDQHRLEAPAHGQQRRARDAFDDSSWASVTLPHTWNATDGQDGGNNYYRGIGWYRRHYTLPASAAGKRVFLQFDGANIVAVVYVNGTMVGTHRGGFARFRFDVTGER